jgi:hypothetical protein
MPSDARTPYAQSLIGLTFLLAFAAALAAGRGGAHTDSVTEVAAQILRPEPAAVPSGPAD